MTYSEFEAIVDFLGNNMTDEQAQQLMDEAKRYLSQDEIDCLGNKSCFYNGKLYTFISEYQGECGYRWRN